MGIFLGKKSLSYHTGFEILRGYFEYCQWHDKHLPQNDCPNFLFGLRTKGMLPEHPFTLHEQF